MSKWETIDLYRVCGLAPTYTHVDAGTFENVTMNWWVHRQHYFSIDYKTMFGGKEYGWPQIFALSQMFLLREAQVFKEWIDNLYPEENTIIYKINPPFPNDISPFPLTVNAKCGSCRCGPYNYYYDLDVWYFVDLNECKFLKPPKKKDNLHPAYNPLTYYKDDAEV